MVLTTAFAGMGFLLNLVYLALTVYLFVLLSRATSALERIASALASKNPESENTEETS